MSGLKTEDEGLYTIQHRYWLDVMKKPWQKKEHSHEKHQPAGYQQFFIP
jgi:benzoate/toluate 1,2-dioxygenase alpha subunit